MKSYLEIFIQEDSVAISNLNLVVNFVRKVGRQTHWAREEAFRDFQFAYDGSSFAPLTHLDKNK